MGIQPAIFARAHYTGVLRPPAEAESLPSWAYTDAEFLERERERLFRAHWLCIGREDQVARPGDYMTREIAGASLIVVRGRDGAVRAFHNACRHRGARLLEGEGSCKAISCPYHAWVYGLDGMLVGAPDTEATIGFEKSAHFLAPARLESWAGFLFVNLDGRAKPLTEHLGDCPEFHAPWSLEDMVVTRRNVFEVECNWKLFIDVFMEYYHLNVVHPSSIAAAYGPADPMERVRGDWITVFGLNGSSALLLQDSAPAAALPAVPGLSGRSAKGTRYSLIYPNMPFACTTQSMWFFEIDPLAPGRTRIGMNMCFPRSTAALEDFAEMAQACYLRWKVAIAEDNTVLERQQRGLASPLVRRGRFSHLEEVVPRFGAWVAERVCDPA